MCTKYKKKIKTDMLSEAHRIKIIKLHILMVNLKNKNLYILLRKYVKIKSEKLCWYHAKSLLTINLDRKFF